MLSATSGLRKNEVLPSGGVSKHFMVKALIRIVYEIQTTFYGGVGKVKKELGNPEAVKDVTIVDLDRVSNDIFMVYRRMQKVFLQEEVKAAI